MPDKVISSVAEVTTEWLTAVLSSSGALAPVTVTSIDLDTDQMVKYSGDARRAVASNRLKNGFDEDATNNTFTLTGG